jgi:cyanophycin synthetase
LEAAIKCAQKVARSFIVEEYIPGNLYRATTVGPTLIACGHREPPMITGDGVHTVQELFEARDAERKALLVSLGYTLANIPPFPQSRMHVDPATVLPTGERVALTWKVNLAFGAGVIDLTDEVHPDNRELFERIAKAVPDFPTVGIDFIAPSIAVSYKEQKCAVIELNSLPSIDLHHPPIVTGVNRNVAGALLDEFLAKQV